MLDSVSGCQASAPVKAIYNANSHSGEKKVECFIQRFTPCHC